MPESSKILPFLKYLFIGVGMGELLAHMMGWSMLNEFTKPLLMPILLVYFRKSYTGEIKLYMLLAVFALVFSWFGDVALMYVYKREVYFLVGLGAFAIAQLLYAFAFKYATSSKAPQLNPQQHAIKLLPFVVFIGGFMWMLWPNLGNFQFPVLGYSLLITAMALSAIYRIDRTNSDSFNQVVLGAMLFVLSDALLAIDKFYSPMANARVWVMSTYLLAQWNIINGLLKHRD